MWWQHGATHRLINCFLLNGPPDNDCGGFNTLAVNLVESLIKNRWESLGLTAQIRDDQEYIIDRAGNLNIRTVTETCYESHCVRTYSLGTELTVAPKLELPIAVVRPRDPNDKVAPAGYGEQHIIGSGQPIRYVINFENMPSATAPVQEVRVTDILNANLDLSTLQFDTIEFGNHSVIPGTAPGILEYGKTEMPPASVVTGLSEGPMVDSDSCKGRCSNTHNRVVSKAGGQRNRGFPDGSACRLPAAGGWYRQRAGLCKLHHPP